MVSRYAYTYDARGFIVEEKAVESLAGYAYDDKHSGRHEDGRHDDLYPHGSKHSKHDKDASFAYQIVETDRTFTYDDAGKLLSATETEDNYGTCVYSYAYDGMGNRTAVIKTNEAGEVVESRKYLYNESNQLVSVELFNGKKTTSVSYTYDADGNLICEIGKDGTDKVELTYLYTVENRLEAVYDKEELLMAAAYDGDGNRVFMLNYNLHTDEDWKGNSGNGNGSNKDNAGSGNNGNGNNSGSNGNLSGNNGNGNSGNSSSNNGKGGNGKNNGKVGNKGSNGNGNSAGGNGNNGNGNSNSGNGNSSGSSIGNGNATNAETNNSQNQSGILFPIASETSDTESYLIGLIKTSGKEKNYELIEYINDVNREYAETLVEQNINGALDTAYVYGAAIGTGSDRLSLDRFDGSTGYYLYDPRGSVTGLTNEEGQIYQSYRYSVFGEITFGTPQYENEYTYNGESYNPNIKSQYLRARYYCVVTADFLTEDSYLGRITEPLTLNRYNYCLSNPMNYADPSGNMPALILNALSYMYNSGLYASKDLALTTLTLNGSGIFTAFHEFAQLNLAKYLTGQGYVTELEYKIRKAAKNGKNGSCGEVDVVASAGLVNYFWEIKPVTYKDSVSNRNDALDQMDEYAAIGLIEGSAIKIDGIEFFGDIKMRLFSDEKRPGLVYYQFYKTRLFQPELVLTNAEVKSEIKAKLVKATVIIGAAAVATLIEDILTGGAGAVDDIPSILGGAALARYILAI